MNNLAMGIHDKLTSISVKKDLANLSMEDPSSRLIAMNSLTKHFNQLDGNQVPNFLKQVSDALDNSKPTDSNIFCHLHAISLFELAARKLRASLVCHLGLMICMLTTALNSRGFNIGLQQACVKLVRSIANYVICPTAMASSEKEKMVRDLCSPLLLKVAEAPGCLHALVKTPCWKFASQDLINEACLQATRALFVKGSQAVGHMELICSLTKKNGLNMKPHVGTLLKEAGEILDNGDNWQQRVCGLQMINSFLKYMNVFQLQEILGVLEKQGQEEMPSVIKVVAETRHRAKLFLENPCVEKTSMTANDRRFISSIQSVEHTYPSSSEDSVSLVNQGIEDYEDGGLDQISGITEWSVRHNPIAHHENIVPENTNGKSISAGFNELRTMMDGLELLWGNGNYEYNKLQSCCADSSDFVGSGGVSSASSVTMENRENQQKLTSICLSEADLEGTKKREKLSNNDEAEAGIQEIILTGNCERMIEEDKSSACWWWKKMGENSWKKARERVDLILGASLCAGLVVPAAMFSIKFFGMQEEFYDLVPT